MALFALITGGLKQDVKRLLTGGLAIGEAVAEVVQESPGSGWRTYPTKKQKRVRLIDATDDSVRKHSLPPEVVAVARKAVKRVVAEKVPESTAIREAVEALRKEVGKPEASKLRADYVAMVRDELAAIQQEQQEEEAIAMCMIYLMAA